MPNPRHNRRRQAGRVVLLAALLLLSPAGGFAAAADAGPAPAAGYMQSAADASALSRLAAAREGLAALALAPDDAARKLAYDTALEALTALYQLHGLSWARPRLSELYRQPDCPDVHTGFSRDGRLYLRVELLELRNPAFAEYTAYLVTLGSLTPQTLRSEDTTSRLKLTLSSGETLAAEQIAPGHPLWPNLSKLAATCHPQGSLSASGAWAFKQFFAVRELNPNLIQAVSLQWGQYRLEVPYYANEVQGG